MVLIEGNGNVGEESFFFRLRGGRLLVFFEVRLGFGERFLFRDFILIESEYGLVLRCVD